MYNIVTACRPPRWFNWRPRNLLTRWDVSSNPGNWEFSIQKTKNKKQKFDFEIDEGKERLNPSREKNLDKHRRRKVAE